MNNMMFYLGASLICIAIVTLAITIHMATKVIAMLKMLYEKIQVQCDDTYQISKSTNYIFNAIDSIHYMLERTHNND